MTESLIRGRAALTADEERRLGLCATRSAEATRRRPAGGDGEMRLAFQRDRDRVLHSRAFRRLKHKTQVFVPHVAEELWSRLDHAEPLAFSGWPEVDEAYLVDDEIDLVIQIKGKVRGRTKAPREASKDDLEALAREAIADQLDGAEVVKTIVVPGKLVNFVVK